MKDIRTRDTVKDIRALDRAANIADRMKSAYVRTKEQAEQTQQTNAESPSAYAEDRAAENIKDVTRTVGYDVCHQGKRLAEKTRQKLNNRYTRERASESERPETRGESGNGQQKTTSTKVPEVAHEPPVGKNHHSGYSAHNSSRERVGSVGPNFTGREARRGVKTVERGVKQSGCVSQKVIKRGAKGSVKTARRGVKTVEQTSHAAVKTAQATAKTTAKTAQATARAAQRAAQAARAAAKLAAAVVKTVAKAIATTVKATIAAVKGVVAAIAAGGWVAVVIIIVVLLVAAVLGSVFGLFAAEESYGDAPSMPEVVSQINTYLTAELDAIIAANPHDTLVIDNAGSASMVANWDEVLAVYAVLVSSDPENPAEVATLDDAKVEKLKTVFWDMNNISYSVDDLVVGTDEETQEPITETVLTISVSYKTAEEMISYYGFGVERSAQVRELLQPEYAELFMRLSGSYVDITLSAAEIAAIMEMLPDDLSEERKEVVLTAYSLLGKVKYFWGGKSLVLGWDSRWGAPMKVTSEGSPSTGMVRAFGLDCSGFVDWVFYNALDKYVIGHGGGAKDQYGYCDAILWNDAQPGDLIFYPGCEHDGIVVKNDAGTLTVIHCASGYNNVVMTQHTEGNGFAFVGRPQIYHGQRIAAEYP